MRSQDGLLLILRLQLRLWMRARAVAVVGQHASTWQEDGMVSVLEVMSCRGKLERETKVGGGYPLAYVGENLPVLWAGFAQR